MRRGSEAPRLLVTDWVQRHVVLACITLLNVRRGIEAASKTPGDGLGAVPCCSGLYHIAECEEGQ